jgi:hypothetical protein
VIDSIAPEKVKIINNKNIIQEPWMTLGLLTSSKKQNKLFRECAGKNKDGIKYKYYKRYRNKLNSLKRTARFSYYKTKILEYKQNGKKMWKLMNEIIGKNNNKLDSLEYINIDGIRNYNKKQIVDGFSDFF